ncbi:transmembrane protein 179-like [Haliotis asinina]|uniref:transmembrane protein 179-like n=1 Tax=Haliotis asinina TaxID=109174 RepID=UPI0035324440
MGLGNIFVLSQVTAFLLSFIFSFFIFVPVWSNLNEFSGNCLLYSSGSWIPQSSTSQVKLNITWGPNSACNFTVFVGVAVMVLSIFYMVWQSRYLCRGIDSSWLDAFVTCAVTLVMTVVLFATALTASVGFREWCSLITNPVSQIERCENGQFDGRIVFTTGLVINTDNYYTEFEMSQFGLWSTWICWLVQSFLSVIKLYRYHRQEAFLTSMNRERERLLQRVGHSSTDPM